MESPNIQSSLNTNAEKQLIYNSNNENIKFDQMMNQVECLIQHQFSIFVPAIVLKYKAESKSNNKKEKEKDFYGWDYNDLFEFFSNFGEIERLEIASNVAIILFKTFVDAYTSKEFMQNAHFKESEKNNFCVDWYRKEDEFYISEIFKEKIKKVSPSEILETIQEKSSNHANKNSSNNAMKEASEKEYSNNNINCLVANNNQTNANLTCGVSSNEQIASNFNAQYNYFATWSMSPNARIEFNSIINNQPIYNINYNKYGYDFEEGKNFSYDKNLFNGKYTCKFEIQIENDNEFQVARRLIGSKVNYLYGFIFPFKINFDIFIIIWAHVFREGIILNFMWTNKLNNELENNDYLYVNSNC